MRKLKLRKRISNFPKATQLVSDGFKLSLFDLKIIINVKKKNYLKWNMVFHNKFFSLII